MHHAVHVEGIEDDALTGHGDALGDDVRRISKRRAITSWGRH